MNICYYVRVQSVLVLLTDSQFFFVLSKSVSSTCLVKSSSYQSCFMLVTIRSQRQLVLMYIHNTSSATASSHNVNSYMMLFLFQRWVRYYRMDRVVRSLRTHDGIESINRSMETSFSGLKKPTLSLFFRKLLHWHSLQYDK